MVSYPWPNYFPRNETGKLVWVRDNVRDTVARSQTRIPYTVADVEALDLAFYNSLKFVQENDPAPLELTFSVLEESFGEEVFSAVRDRYMRDGEGFLLVYSLVERTTFVPMHKISEQIKRVKDTDRHVPICLVGNKSDMADKREVSYGEGELLARTLNCPFFETSAKLRVNIDECFHELIREIKRAEQERSKDLQKEAKKGNKCVLL